MLLGICAFYYFLSEVMNGYGEQTSQEKLKIMLVLQDITQYHNTRSLNLQS